MKHLFIFLISLILFSSCNQKRDINKPTIAVSIEPLRYFVEQIAGNQYKVFSLTPQGASPETYEPTPRQMVDLSHSRIYFAIGTLGYEQTQLNKIVQSNKHLRVIMLNKGIALIQANSQDCHHSYDPHIWMSTRNARTIAQSICHELCKLDTAKSAYYQKNLEKVYLMIDSVEKRVRHQLSQVVHRTFLIYHPALGYFSRDYGLRQLCVEKDGKEPSAKQLQNLLELCQKDSVTTVFIEKEYYGQAARNIAQYLRTPVISINPLNYHWPDEMVLIAKSFKK